MTDSNQKRIVDLMREHAADLKLCHCVGNDWRNEREAKAAHNELLELAQWLEQSGEQGTPPIPEAVRELLSGIRTINRATQHLVEVEGDDEPCYYQRSEWIKWMLELADKAEHAISAGQQPWNDMSTAPTDGTVIQLLVRKADLPGCIDAEEDGELTRTLGFNNLDHDQSDDWHVVGWSWTHDCFTDVTGGIVKPVGWLPLAPLPTPAQEG